MIKNTLRRAGALAALAGIVLLAGCATSANRDAMTAGSISSAKKNPYSLSVKTGGGNETSAMGSSEISNDDLRAAIEKSVTQSALFKEVVQGKNGDYELSVTVARLSKPTFGASFTVDMEAGWSLVKASDKSVVMRKSITSSYTASMGDSLVGVTRLRLAVEGAARNNIKQGLEAIAAMNL
jgi:uncharacterized lipoprotein YajG